MMKSAYYSCCIGCNVTDSRNRHVTVSANVSENVFFNLLPLKVFGSDIGKLYFFTDSKSCIFTNFHFAIDKNLDCGHHQTHHTHH